MWFVVSSMRSWRIEISPVFPVVGRWSGVCSPAEGPHHTGENAGLQSRRSGSGIGRSWRPYEHLVAAGENRKRVACVKRIIYKQYDWKELVIHYTLILSFFCQDGSVLQTVVAGSGAIQNIVWIPDVGVAVCSNRSKVGRLSLVQAVRSFFAPLLIHSVIHFLSRMCWSWTAPRSLWYPTTCCPHAARHWRSRAWLALTWHPAWGLSWSGCLSCCRSSTPTRRYKLHVSE